MENTVPYEHWKVLSDQAQQLNLSSRKVERFFRWKKRPPERELQKYLGEYAEFVRIMKEIREKCAELKIFLDHDFNNYLSPLALTAATFGRVDQERCLEIVRKYLFVPGIIQQVVGSVKFYVDGVLETSGVAMTEFLPEELPALKAAFGNGKRCD
jgi:hypothetical protein